MHNILLIDDSPVQMTTRQAVLSMAGFHVLTADSAPLALSLLKSKYRDIDLIITDHIMPSVSGAKFVRQLREVDAEVPVIVVSGLPGAEEEYAGLGVEFRLKPVAPTELITLVRSMTGESGKNPS